MTPAEAVWLLLGAVGCVLAVLGVSVLVAHDRRVNDARRQVALGRLTDDDLMRVARPSGVVRHDPGE